MTKPLGWLRRAAEQDDRVGQFTLGVMYANGWGVTQDDAEAEKWFLKGLENHDEEERALAQFNMGDMYGRRQKHATKPHRSRKVVPQGPPKKDLPKRSSNWVLCMPRAKGYHRTMLKQ